MKYYIDCEFDGHAGKLLSIGIVREDGFSGYFQTTVQATEQWVIENIIPIMNEHQASVNDIVSLNEIGQTLRSFIGLDKYPIIIADSPVDVGRFCVALSTDKDGGWCSCEYPQIMFEVHNVDCYPTNLENAVQHNAWWDAMALKAYLN